MGGDVSMEQCKRKLMLRCGEKQLAVTVPEGVRFQYAQLNPVQKCTDAAEVIRAALDEPVGAERIEQLVKPGQKICIISDDNTRKTPARLILKELLPRLESAGIRREDILIVMALGSHRPMTKEEMVEKVGVDVFNRYRVCNSEFEDPEKLVQVGFSELGTPIRVFKPAMEADIRIGIGTVVPHGCMGWSGGAKILYPGITSADIVSEFHVMQGLYEEILIGMDECPVRLAVEEWTQKIGLHYIINTILDDKLELYKAVSGDYVKAHRRAVSYAKEICAVSVQEQPDVVLTASYPISLDYWQCSKAIYGPGRIIKEGGELLVLAACTEGIGPHDQLMEYLTIPDGAEALRKKVANGDTGEDLLAMAVGISSGKVARRCHQTVISDGMDPAVCAVGNIACRAEADLQTTLEEALARFDDPFLLIIPEGGEALPLLSEVT